MLETIFPRASLGFGRLPTVHFQQPDVNGRLPPLPERHEPGPYLCQLVQDYAPDKWPEGGAIVERKVDGIRAIWRGCGPPESREGQTLEVGWWLGGPLDILAERLGPGSWFVDGEITVGETFDSTIAAHARRRQHPDATLHVFDAIPVAEWESGRPGDPLWVRKERLRRAFAAGPIEGLRLLDGQQVDAPQLAETLAQQVWDAGGEGVVIKDACAPYVRSRSKAWLKLKRAATWTVTVESWRPMRKPSPDGIERLGVLLCRFGGRRLRVGAGFTDDERIELARIGDGLRGRLAEVTAMERTISGNLRQPRFSRWRHECEGQ